MGNQQKILPMGQLQGVTVDIDSVSTQINFEVTEIVDDSNTYLALLGIDWATNMKGIINLKKVENDVRKEVTASSSPVGPSRSRMLQRTCAR